jgi:hypothetical protein
LRLDRHSPFLAGDVNSPGRWGADAVAWRQTMRYWAKLCKVTEEVRDFLRDVESIVDSVSSIAVKVGVVATVIVSVVSQVSSVLMP